MKIFLKIVNQFLGKRLMVEMVKINWIKMVAYFTLTDQTPLLQKHNNIFNNIIATSNIFSF